MTDAIALTQWPSLAGDPRFFNAAALYFNCWKKLGLGDPFILGMLAQAEAESAIRVDVVGDNDTAFGIHQWHVDRCAALAAGCGVDPRKRPPIPDQVRAAWWELRSIETAALRAIDAAASASEAGIAACAFYERAGAPGQAQKRGAMAERWAALFAAHPELLAANPA